MQPTQSGSERRVHEVRLTDEQFQALWELYPNDDGLISAACRQALYTLRTPPNMQGVWPKYGVRVYYDDYGFNTSGYMLVHWEDAKRVAGPWLGNGYCTDPEFQHENMEWDHSDDEKRERYRSIQKTLLDWAY